MTVSGQTPSELEQASDLQQPLKPLEQDWKKPVAQTVSSEEDEPVASVVGSVVVVSASHS